jgi:hypothetical protein
MKLSRTAAAVALVAVWIASPRSAEWPTAEKVDLDAVFRIKDEGLQRSKVMEIESYLTDVYGPRLTGSPNIREAADWTQKTMKEWGLANVHLETWPFGRGWQNQRFVALATAPRSYPLIAFPKAWTPGTNGPVTGQAVLAVIQNENDFARYRGALRGRFVLTERMRDVLPHFEAPGRRFTEADLTELTRQPVVRGRGNAAADSEAQKAFERKKTQFWLDEGVAALLEPGRGDGGTIFVTGGGSRDPKEPPVPAQIVLAVEQYGRILRTLEKRIPVMLEMDIDNKWYDGDLNGFNVIAELPGTDKADEVVMLGAHFDSWHSGTGATDNGAGSAVMMEVMRILKSTGLRLRRTVRLALWGGEEQGHLGSKAFVKEHLGDPATMQLRPGHEKLSVYFNLDNGTGTIRGVYLQNNEAVAPVFAAWMEPFKNLGMTTLAIRGTGGTDHTSFDAVGLPGFQFIQDPIEYNPRSHHSNMDVFERVVPQDMMQNAVIIASFVYHAANREERLPRKPLPKPSPPAQP